MGCDFPIKVYRSAEVTPAGKRLVVFTRPPGQDVRDAFEIPCNNCMGCRLERSRQWAVRMLHESKCWEQNCFITLTYDDQALPTNYGLDLRHWQLFMKKLRQAVPQKIRFFACGEYGDENGRPHYHAAIFNHDFGDKRLHDYNKQGDAIYISETLGRIWGQGHCTTQDLTFGSASYVARYCTKKVTGGAAPEHYFRVSPVDGQVYSVKPEFAVMSRRPGIGSTFVEQFKSDFYPSGFLVVNGVKQAPPRFYLTKLTEEEQGTLKLQARARARRHRRQKTMERRLAKAAVRDAKISTLKRNL